MMERPIWFDYVTYDEEGFVNGVKEDTPEDIKKEYEKYLKLNEKGIKI